MKKQVLYAMCGVICFALSVTVFCGCGTDNGAPDTTVSTQDGSAPSVNPDIPAEDSFTDEGMPLISVSKDSDGVIIGYSEFEYSGGNMVKQTKYDGEGKMTSYLTYEYDSQNRTAKSTEYSADGSISGYIEYEYNSEGTIARTYDAEGELINEKKEYEELIH